MALQFSKIQFDIKAVGVILILAAMWYDLKTDFAIYKEKHNFLEYRVGQLENKKMAVNTYRNSAIMPDKPKREDEEDN